MISAKLVENGGRYSTQVGLLLHRHAKGDLGHFGFAARDGQTPKEEKERNITARFSKRATVFVDVGRNDVPNLSAIDLILTSAYALSGEESAYRSCPEFRREAASERENGDFDRQSEGSRRRWPVGNASVGNEFVTVLPGEPKAIEFAYKFPSPGTYVVQVKLDGDALELDNVRSLVLTVKDTIPVLLVNGKPAPDRFDQSSISLGDRSLSRSEPKFAPLRPKVLTVTQFQDLPENELTLFDCIFLADVAQLGPAEARQLENHVRRGGGLVLPLAT